MVNIESVEFTAHMDNEGNVTYTDKDNTLEIAKQNKATHRDTLTKNCFYKKEQFGTKRGFVIGGQFIGWERYRSYPPEWATVI